MFVDELTIAVYAGNGGDGVVRWHRTRHKPKGGPAGGNGGGGGDVYLRAVPDLNRLSRYTGIKEFRAENGMPGAARSRDGARGADCIIDVPVGALVTDTGRDIVYRMDTEGTTVRILSGGTGGRGNEHFKSATNRSPKEHTQGTSGQSGTFHIELPLTAHVGLIGMPNAGKSTLLNTLSAAHSPVGAYPFTTTQPHLCNWEGYIIADIPGLIVGAAQGKGLGHKFLRHIRRTQMLLHLVSLENEDVRSAYEAIRAELVAFDPLLAEKEEWVLLTKSDAVDEGTCRQAREALRARHPSVHVISAHSGAGIEAFTTALRARLTTNSAP